MFWIAERHVEKKNWKIQKQLQWILLHLLRYTNELYIFVNISLCIFVVSFSFGIFKFFATLRWIKLYIKNVFYA